MGNPRTVQELYDFVKSFSPKLVFLSETRMRAIHARNLTWRLGLSHSLAVSSVGLSGGLALYWDESINVTLLYQGDRALDVLVNETMDGAPWRATFVYGEPHVENRKFMWELLRRLKGSWVGPWLMMGDFNEGLWQHEHFWETPRPER